MDKRKQIAELAETLPIYEKRISQEIEAQRATETKMDELAVQIILEEQLLGNCIWDLRVSTNRHPKMDAKTVVFLANDRLDEAFWEIEKMFRARMHHYRIQLVPGKVHITVNDSDISIQFDDQEYALQFIKEWGLTVRCMDVGSRADELEKEAAVLRSVSELFE